LIGLTKTSENKNDPKHLVTSVADAELRPYAVRIMGLSAIAVVRMNIDTLY